MAVIACFLIPVTCTKAASTVRAWILERYALRFQIEFIFRNAKQFTSLTHCQSTNKTKLENHFNLALGAVSVAKAAHWLPIDKEQRGPFSMAKLKTYYHNLALVGRFSIALNLNPTEIKNNPKIKELLFLLVMPQSLLDLFTNH